MKTARPETQKKTWKKSRIITITANELAKFIKASSKSTDDICIKMVFR